jgi:hypothetical protein
MAWAARLTQHAGAEANIRAFYETLKDAGYNVRICDHMSFPSHV